MLLSNPLVMLFFFPIMNDNNASPCAPAPARPKPVYHSTASQLGLHKTRGIPSLLDYVLPRNAPQVHARLLTLMHRS
jgi:hypothetical protein